jgi:hypothetical protein
MSIIDTKVITNNVELVINKRGDIKSKRNNNKKMLKTLKNWEQKLRKKWVQQLKQVAQLGLRSMIEIIAQTMMSFSLSESL